MESPGLNLNLMDQLVFYGTYHQKKWNQAIHWVFVPLIMWSIAEWLAYTGPLAPWLDISSHLSFLPAEIAGAAVLNGAALFIALYALYYTVLEPFAGTSWLVVVGLPMWISATYTYQHVPYGWAWSLGANILGWFMQVAIGHTLIEHRRPALLDSFFQSLVLAGLFAWMEGLFALNYRPKMQAELKRRIQDNQEALASKREALLASEAARSDPFSAR